LKDLEEEGETAVGSKVSGRAGKKKRREEDGKRRQNFDGFERREERKGQMNSIL